MHKFTSKRQSSKLLLISVFATIILAVMIVCLLYTFKKLDGSKTSQTQPTVLAINKFLQQNGAVQICSAGNTKPGGLTASSMDIVYEINKNQSDTITLIKKAATDSGYSDLTPTATGAADFYEGSNPGATAKIGFVVYRDREYMTCDPTPSNDPNRTAFMLSGPPTK